MGQKPDTKSSNQPDNRTGNFIFPFITGWVRETRILAGIWIGTVLALSLFCFTLPPETGLVFYLFLGVNIISIGWCLWIMNRMKRSTRDLLALVSLTRDMIWSLDSDFKMTGLLGAVFSITGKDGGKLRGRPFTDILSRKDAQAFSAFVQKNISFKMTAEILTPHGGTTPVEITAQPVSGKSVWQGSIRDLSDSARLEDLNTELKTKLAEAEKLKRIGLIAGSVAHDLNNILSGIATYPEVLLQDQTLAADVRQGLVMIKDSGRSASGLVSDLLTLSRGIKADKQVLNINTVIERYMAADEFLKIRQAYDQVKIEVATEPELLNIRGSYIHIEKIIMNLVLNAVEETADRPGGRVFLSTANHYADGAAEDDAQTDLAPGEYVILRVEDNGAGIPKERLDKIYEPFFAQKEMGKSGTGLGLTVVLNAVQDHRGIIRVASGPGGTRFVLFFPAIREDLPKHDPYSLDEIRGNGETLLIVDDLADQRMIAATILKNLGYHVFTVEDGVAALEFVQSTSVDLLVLDMVMAPSISGLETYERIRQIYPGQKAIIASGHSESEDVLKARELGAGSFVKKPYTIMDMGIAVKEELEK